MSVVFLYYCVSTSHFVSHQNVHHDLFLYSYLTSRSFEKGVRETHCFYLIYFNMKLTEHIHDERSLVGLVSFSYIRYSKYVY